MKVLLNFFGEKTEITLPSTVSGLRKIICDQYLFSPSDADELVISYIHNQMRMTITNEIDYKALLQLSSISEINLDVSENSKLYQDKKRTVEEEQQALFKELSNLKTEEKEMLEENEEYIVQVEFKQKEISDQIRELKDQLIKIHFDYKTYSSDQTKKINDKRKEIKDLEETLNIPFEERLKPIDISQLLRKKKWNGMNRGRGGYGGDHGYNRDEHFGQEMMNNNKETEGIIFDLKKAKLIKPQTIVLHNRYSCDGCGMKPIQGFRYKCTVCKDFDYCEVCHTIYHEIHLHPFVCITDPNFNNNNIPYNDPNNYLPFDLSIHK